MTSQPAPTTSDAGSFPRRWWLGALAGAAVVVGVAAHNTREVVRVRDRARDLERPRDHQGTVGYGIGQPLHLVVIGDSSADGYGLPDASAAVPRQVATRLAKASGRPVRITSLAREGARTADVIVRQAPYLRGLDPDAVVIVAGVNDAIGRTRPASVAADTARLADLVLDALPGAAVAYVGCPNLRYAPGLPKPLHLVVGLACRAVARAQQRTLADHPVSFVDLYVPLEPEDFGLDGFHPGAAGSARIAERVVEALTADETLERVGST